ncbi:MAG: hypothetical protein QOJ34_1917 [Pseudonocardiales bacterium]|jgi:uncharacterized protein (TIGR03086 family)|nr:hypothetical protein [Pseudonocardiales bacterium]
MDPMVEMFLSAQRAFGARVRAVGADQLGLPTPNTEWDVSALLGHLLDENWWLPPLAHGHDLDAAGKIVESAEHAAGDDRVKAWETASVKSADAVQEEGVLERTASLSRGPTPMRDYLGEMIFDHIVHAWDLGKAIGYSGDEPLPEDVVEVLYPMATGMADMLAGSGMFAAPVEVPDDASTLDKLLGLTGRDPNWTPKS